MRASRSQSLTCKQNSPENLSRPTPPTRRTQALYEDVEASSQVEVVLFRHGGALAKRNNMHFRQERKRRRTTAHSGSAPQPSEGHRCNLRLHDYGRTDNRERGHEKEGRED